DDGCDSNAACTHVNNTAGCDDGNACTANDVCGGGSCISGAAVTCNDSNVCTNDSCVPATGCVYLNNTVACDDGDACTDGDTCVDGSCASGSALDCDDSNLCTNDGCDPATGCTTTAVNCGDNNACTIDLCLPATGCVHSPVPCNDGTACTTDGCDPDAGCTFTPIVCDDDDVCTSDGCSAALGCTFAPINCNDNNACTIDSCTPGIGCVSTPITCNDNNVCTTDGCNPATGCTTTPINCSDDDACTTDSCHPVTGCFTTPITCNDSNPCTTDSCDPALGCTTTPVVCDDGNACTGDVCNPAVGCTGVQVNCNDGNPCNGTEICDPQTGCKPGAPLICDDGNPCTDDLCAPAIGCYFVASVSVACLPPGAICAVSGAAGTIVTCPLQMARATFVTPKPVGAQIEMTFDPSAVSILGFQDLFCAGPGNQPPCANAPVPPAGLYPTGHTVIPFPADPNNWSGVGNLLIFNTGQADAAITEAYGSAGGFALETLFLEMQVQLTEDIDPANPQLIMGGLIKGVTADAGEMTGAVTGGVIVMSAVHCTGIAGLCDDENLCTTDSCDSDTGSCTHETIECDDGDVCNGSEVCAPLAGCQPGVPLSCSTDGDICTADGCDPNTGCNPPISCDDNVLCTSDVCDPVNGCTHTPVDAACDDGFGCTANTCDALTGCQVQTDDSQCDDGNECTSDACVPGQGCVHIVQLTDGCLPPDALCGFSGSAGTIIDCPIRLARATDPTPSPVALQFTATMPANALQPIGFFDDLCLGPGGGEPCIEVQVPPAPLSPTGHQMGLFPADVANWAGVGKVTVFHLSDPNSAINDAYQSAGSFVGDTEFVLLRVQLVADVDPQAPAYVYAGAITAATSAAEKMTGTVIDGVMVVSVADCTAFGGVCDDGNACTTDECDPISKQCEFTAVDCDDANVCNGQETCDISSGCQPGTPLVCDSDDDLCTQGTCDPAAGCNAPVSCDDSIGCTDDSCDSEIGCVHTPDDAACDDGHPCTSDGCNIASGCVYLTDDAACNDSDPCTADSCVEGQGCVFAPLLTPACLPPFAFCGVAGAAGATVVCPIQLGRITQSTPQPTSGQFLITYDDAQLTATALQDIHCFGPGGTEPCTLVDTPPSPLYPSGHQVVIQPAAVSNWAGVAQVLLFNLSNPTAALSDAYKSGGAVVGEPQIAELHVTLDQDVPATSPVYLFYSDVKGSTAAAQKLIGTVENGVMLLGLADCNLVAGVCDDGDACTVDTCQADGSCGYAALVCDDGDVCNGFESCDIDTGCVAGQPLVCEDDDNACTQAQCHPTIGCDAPVSCDDGIGCTIDSCDTEVGCVYTPNDASCDDGELCSQDQCDANVGCVYQELAGVCDDSNPCTTDSCAPGVGCEYAPVLTPVCLPPDTFCGVAGSAGQSVTCEIRMARATPTTPAPTSAQFDILFDAGKLNPVTFQDYVCFGPGGTEPCADVDTPPQNLYPTGHSVSLVGADPAAWPGTGSVVLFNASNPSAAISDAALAGGTFVGDTLILTMVVELVTDISPLSPTYLSYAAIKGATATAEKMNGSVVQGVMVLGLADCTTVAGICDDANACTTDQCDPDTKACVYTTIECDDNDVCNGLETCNPATGCVAGQALSCVDDEDPCTTAGCDPLGGCNAPDDCNDGVACTEDSCDPTAGCQHTPQNTLCNDNISCTVDTCDGDDDCQFTPVNAMCDDGDVCTTDVCDIPTGCQHPPVLTSACLPDGVLCGVVGNVGDEVVCKVQLARATAATPLPTAAQFVVGFDPALIQAQTMRDLVCLGPGGTEPCLLLDTPPATLYPSGHTVALNAAAPTAWPGSGNVAIFNPSDPTSAVSNAFVFLGTIDGDAQIAEFVVKLTASVAAVTPAYITLSGVKGSTETAQEMTGTVQNGVMILSLLNCNQNPSACDDGNECTADQCGADGICTSTPVVCDDGNVCNGSESCDPLAGCQSGAPLDCPDDGDACTVEGCDPSAGCTTTPFCNDNNACTVDSCDDEAQCTYTPTDSLCDDGVACTIDTCDGVLGCVATPSNAACNDADPCTTDSCNATSGCTTLPVLTPTCLPDGAVCGFAGNDGDTGICKLRLARATIETAIPTGVQFDLSYNSSLLSATALKDLVCFGPGGTEPCLDLDVPPSTLFPSGHTVTLNPAAIGSWVGAGSVVVFHLADPSSAVTEAYLQFTSVIGTADFVDLHVELAGDVDPAAPVYVYAANIKGVTATAQKLSGFAQNGLLVLQDAGCEEICDDNNACTDDACDVATSTCVYTPKVCDDNDVCTGVETCDPSVGCVAGTPLSCDPDDDPCTSDGCDPLAGCNPPDPCDDGIACTSDVCDPVVGCTYAEIHSACDDGLVCTADFCSALTGCWVQPDSGACDDGNPCTANVCDETQGCQYPPESTPECLPPGTFCAVSGAMGSTVECSLQLARATQTTPDPAGSQFGIQFVNSLVSIAGIVDLTCFGPGGTEPCLDVAIPPATLYPTGHTVVVNPANPASWPGAGSVAIFHTSDPNSAISSAYIAAGQVQGDPEFARLVVTLDQTISPLTPTYLSYANIKGSTASAQPMVGVTLLGTMVLSLKDCNEQPDVCDDDNACTTDTCDAGSGLCQYTTVTCDDGDVCNGVETCDTQTGCVAGVAPVCEDDGNLCTDDSCDPVLGCNSPLVCDDGVGCTSDACDAVLGCVHTADDGVCDDGLACTTDDCDAIAGCTHVASDAACDDSNPCTVDSCDAGVGCIHELLVTGECLPAGAFCGVAGTAGAIVDCPIHLARLTQNTPDPTGAQFT
ncbi:MAG: hypothetical protein HUU55_21255, partial [Myxococcales bacterium]|nr:hypothetical protein [Myxococcales bacterium]